MDASHDQVRGEQQRRGPGNDRGVVTDPDLPGGRGCDVGQDATDALDGRELAGQESPPLLSTGARA
jgi:hypothetical protein